jgi:hypothetical protein
MQVFFVIGLKLIVQNLAKKGMSVAGIVMIALATEVLLPCLASAEVGKNAPIPIKVDGRQQPLQKAKPAKITSQKVQPSILEPLNKTQSNMVYTATVQWQMLRSRAHSSLAGTTTESYSVDWSIMVKGTSATIVTPHAKFDFPWMAASSSTREGTIQATRGDFARLLGIEQELPQDGRLWQEDLPLVIQIQNMDSRVFDPLFKYSDDNGTVLIRLLARVKPDLVSDKEKEKVKVREKVYVK